MLLSSCLVGDSRSDQRQSYLFEDIFEDFEDGTLCALRLRSERNSEALPVLPSKEEYSMLSNNSKGKLLDPLRFVAPQRFVTSSLVQTLTYIDNLLPGTEIEVAAVSSQSRILMMIQLSCTPVVTVRHSLPEAVLRCRYRKVIMTTETWKCRCIQRATVAISHQSTGTGTWLWTVTGRAAQSMEYHDESPPPGGPPGARGAVPQFDNPDQVLSPPMPWPAPASQIIPVPIPPHPQFPIPPSLRPPSPRNVPQTRARGTHPDDKSKAKSRTVVGPPVVWLPGQSAGKQDPASAGDFRFLRASSSSDPAAVPGLPVTEGEFPIQQTPLPEPPVPKTGEMRIRMPLSTTVTAVCLP